MNIYEKLAFVANIILIAIILATLIDVMLVAVPILITLVIVLLHKINFDKKICQLEESGEERKKSIDYISKRIDDMSEGIIEMKVEVNRIGLSVDSKISQHRTDIEASAEKNYREIVGRMATLENRLNRAKKNLASYIWYLERKMETRRQGF